MPGRTINGLAGPSESRKRSRRAVEDDEEVEVEKARSNLRNDAVCYFPLTVRPFLGQTCANTRFKPKRARLSNAGSNKNASRRNRDVTPSEASDDDVEMDGGGIASPPKTQYEDMRDGDFKHLEHQEQDDYLATQMIRRNRTRADEMVGDNVAALNGILQSITCVNFMCHERLKVELGPLLNFVVGENGSGKSAILTAITLCLGGKASSTNRGGSLKNFVKEGCERASLIVKIKNEGDDGYRKDLYGKSIIIERHFSKNGGSGFKVKSEMGGIVSTKKSEVDEIVEYYALQVDNPLNVLSQDNARQFLNAASPAKKYKYFIEGVQLEQLDRDYRLVQEFLEQSEAKAPLQKEQVDILEAARKKAFKAHEAAQSNGQARRHLRLLRNQIIWSQVAAQEQKVAGLDQEIVDADQEIGELEENIAAYTTKMQEYDNLIAEKTEVLEVAKQEDAEFEAGLLAVKHDYDEARKVMEKTHHDERAAFGEAKAAKNSRTELERKINEEMRRLEESNGDKPIQLRKDLERATERRKQLDEEVTAMKESVAELQARAKDSERKYEASQQALKDAQQATRQKTQEITETKRGIERLQHGQGGKFDAYPQKMDSLIQSIQADDGFKDKPIGPIGIHLQLLAPKWSSVLESTLGGTLNSFIVTNVSDQRRLQDMMGRIGVRDCSINIGNRHHIDTSGHEPDFEIDGRQVETIMRVLNIDNDVVRSQLIINQAIEQVILIEDRVKGQEVMFNGRTPRNVRHCLVIHDTMRNHGLMLASKNNGASIKSDPIRPSGRPARMKTDMGAQVTAQQEILQYLQQELRDLQKRMGQLQNEHEANMNELSEKKREIQDKTKAWKRLENQILTVVDVQIQNIEAELDQYEGADSRLDGLKEQLKELQQNEEHYSIQYAELRVKKENFGKEVEVRLNALRTEKGRKKEYEKKVQDAENMVQRLHENRRITLEEKNTMHQQLDSAKIEKTRKIESRQREAEALESFTAEAVKMAPDRVFIPEGHTPETVKAQYQAVGRQVAEAEKRRGISDREAKIIYDEADAAYKTAKINLEVLERINCQMKRTLNERLAKWRNFQRFVSSNARGQFASLLSERSYRGQLLLDHKNHTLQLRVETEKTDKNAAGKNTKSLSGGEKSFSSICLLLAIWDAMGSPLRCLDEFDVFMDNVNRAISTNMLVSPVTDNKQKKHSY